MEDNKDNKETVQEQKEKTQKKPRKKAEAKTEGETKGKTKAKAEEKPAVKEETKSETKSEAKAETETKTETEAKAPTKTMAEKAIDRFSEMMVTRLEEMKGQQWEKGWIDCGGKIQGLPQNPSGERFYGHNDFFLQLHTAMNGYDTPVYATYKQLQEAGATVGKGEKAMPVLYWNTTHKDEQGKTISDEAYKAMTKAEQEKVKTVPVMMGYYVWNLQQTNFPEVKPELFAKLQEQFKMRDTTEEMYKEGMAYYGSIGQEKGRQGSEKRPDHEAEVPFGDAKYAKEALVSELTGAVVGSSMGIDKRIQSENTQHVDAWMDTLKKEPRFILSVVADVNKASKQIIDHIDKQRVEQGLTPLQPKVEAGSKEKTGKEKTGEVKDAKENKEAKVIPLEQFNKLETADGKKIDHFAVFKLKSGNYGVRAMVDGQQMGVKALNKEDRNAFFEHTTTKAALVQKYYGKELSQPKHEERSRGRAV